MPLSRSHSFRALTCPSRCGHQGVSGTHSVALFRILTCPSRCGHQGVSSTRPVAFFPCSDLSLPMRSPGSEWYSLGLIVPYSDSSLRCGLQLVSATHSVVFFFHALTCLFRCDFQIVSVNRQVAFLLCLDLFLTMRFRK